MFTLEAKDYSNSLLKNNLRGKPYFFVDWGTSRVFILYTTNIREFSRRSAAASEQLHSTRDTPSGRCWSRLEHEGHSAEEWKGLGVF